MPVSDAELRETYIPYFQEFKSSIDATQKAIERLFPEESPERDQAIERLVEIRTDIEVELGDPYRIAVRRALDKLESEGMMEAMHSAWDKAAAVLAERIPPQEWTPVMMENLIRSSAFVPYAALSFDEGGNLQDWKVISKNELSRWKEESTGFIPVVFQVERDMNRRRLEIEINQALHFIRTRSQREIEKERGERRFAEYPHELVLGMLPKDAYYIVRWTLPTDPGSFRERRSSRDIIMTPGVLEGRIEDDYAWVKVEGRGTLESLLNRLREQNLISRKLLGNDVLQVATEFWDPERRRWVSVSEVVAEFDDFERWILG